MSHPSFQLAAMPWEIEGRQRGAAASTAGKVDLYWHYVNGAGVRSTFSSYVKAQGRSDYGILCHIVPCSVFGVF